MTVAEINHESSHLEAWQQENAVLGMLQKRIERIVRLACVLLNAPVGVVVLAEKEVKTVQTLSGIASWETARSALACAQSIMEGESLVVHDARWEMGGSDGLGAYAGLPLWDGLVGKVGALCVIDRTDRRFSKAELEVLHDLAAMLEAQIIGIEHGAPLVATSAETLERLGII